MKHVVTLFLALIAPAVGWSFDAVKIVSSSSTPVFVQLSTPMPVSFTPVAGSTTVVSFNGSTQPVSAVQSGSWVVDVSTSRVRISDGVDTASVTASGAIMTDGSATTQPISAVSLPTHAVTQSGGPWTVTPTSYTTVGNSLPVVSTSIVITGSLPAGSAALGTVTATQSTAASLQASVSINGSSRTVDAAQSGTWTVQPGNTQNTTSWLVVSTAPVTANAGTNLNTSALVLEATVGRAQASTTSGQTGPLIQGAVTTTPPSYTTAQTDPLSLNRGGALRVDISSITGNTIATGNGVAGTDVIRVSQVSDGTGILATVTNVATIGTSVTPGTGASNLGKAEDAAHTSADVGVFVLAVRSTQTTAIIGSELEYGPFTLDQYGALKVTQAHNNAIHTSTVTAATALTAFGGSFAAPGANLSIYISAIHASASVAATTVADSRLEIKSGTGGACGTGTNLVWSSFNAVNDEALYNPQVPIKITANNEVCFMNAVVGSKTFTLDGFIAP